jgi:DNA-binding response OmpR family regulator
MSQNSRQTILIVDDNVDNITSILRILGQSDADLMIAQSGEEAIRASVKYKPDLILLDISMPVIGGCEVCRRLQEFEGTNQIPYIFLAGPGQVSDIVEGFKLGAVDYINKPFLDEELKTRVTTHLKKIKATKELRELLKHEEFQKQQLIELNQKIKKTNSKIRKKNAELVEKNTMIEEQANKLAAAIQQLKIINRQLDVGKAELEFKNQEILSGIRYAQTIQNALLPEESKIRVLFPEHFVLFKPKESVGGDFYFFDQNNGYINFGVADCTGHGVPGAFITMLGMSFLDRNNTFVQNSQPAAILESLRSYIKRIFKNSENRSAGMDAVFCKIDTRDLNMVYAGAFMSFYLIRGGEITEYKGNKNPVGAFPLENPFENFEVQLFENDQIYIFSDGYIDQFGDKTDKKFIQHCLLKNKKKN